MCLTIECYWPNIRRQGRDTLHSEISKTCKEQENNQIAVDISSIVTTLPAAPVFTNNNSQSYIETVDTDALRNLTDELSNLGFQYVA